MDASFKRRISNQASITFEISTRIGLYNISNILLLATRLLKVSSKYFYLQKRENR